MVVQWRSPWEKCGLTNDVITHSSARISFKILPRNKPNSSSNPNQPDLDRLILLNYYQKNTMKFNVILHLPPQLPSGQPDVVYQRPDLTFVLY